MTLLPLLATVLTAFYPLLASFRESRSTTSNLSGSYSRPIYFSKRQSFLYPVYVGHGSTSILDSGCSLSLFDLGGDYDHIDSFFNLFNQLKSYYRHSPIEYLILSHIHRDHTNFLNRLAASKSTIKYVVSNLSAKERFSTLGLDQLPGKPVFRFLDSGLNHQPFVNAERIAPLCEDSGIYLSFLWGTLSKNNPDASKLYLKHYENNNSVVVGVGGVDIPVLFTGDINSVGQNLLLRKYRNQLRPFRQGIMFAPHHGFSNGVNREFLSFMQPRAVIISRDARRLMKERDLRVYSNSIVNPLYPGFKTMSCQPDETPGLAFIMDLLSRSCTLSVSKSVITLSPSTQFKIRLR